MVLERYQPLGDRVPGICRSAQPFPYLPIALLVCSLFLQRSYWQKSDDDSNSQNSWWSLDKATTYESSVEVAVTLWNSTATQQTHFDV